MSNSFGKLFTVISFGESHGKCIGIVVDGCPAGLSLTEADFQADLARRRAGDSPASTSRLEKDRAEILSGVLHGFTTGAPICFLVNNDNVNDLDYAEIRTKMRPGHADFPAYKKYGGFNDWRGGGRFSGRITAGFVMAGTIAKKLLELLDIKVTACAIEIGGVAVDSKKGLATKNIRDIIATAKNAGDSLGGIIEGTVLNVPAGLGEPVFDTLDGELAKALLSIPAVKGVEFGAGFNATRIKGSQNNDPFTIKNGKIITTANNSGGILGGISNGMPLIVRVAVKPTASIALEQQTVDIEKMESAAIKVKGRHDVCIVPRAVPVVEAMMAVTLCDFAMQAGLIPRVIKGKKS
jgi:chorismate synthase